MALLNEEKLKRLTARQMIILRKGDLRMIMSDSEILSCLTGKLGPFVIRQVHGRPVVTKRVEHFRVSHSEKAVFQRNKFTVAQQFARFIISIPVLKRIWKEAPIEGFTAYNRIIKYNAGICGALTPNVKNIITPQANHFTIKDAVLKDNLIRLKMKPPFRFREGDSIKIIRMLYNPVKKKDDKFILSEIKAIVHFPEVMLLESAEQKDACKKYKSCIYFLALIRETEDEVMWSNTAAI